eukprot:jgi/Chrpa1/8340/Chrysochromulina_OHIO_Genome00001905-RA
MVEIGFAGGGKPSEFSSDLGGTTNAASALGASSCGTDDWSDSAGGITCFIGGRPAPASSASTLCWRVADSGGMLAERESMLTGLRPVGIPSLAMDWTKVRLDGPRTGG